MSSRKKTTVGFLLILGVSAVLSAGVSGASSAPTRALTQARHSTSQPLFLYLSGPLNMPLTVAFDQGMIAAAKDLGVTAQYDTPANVSNFVPDYSTLIKEAIGRHPAGLAIGDFFPSSVDPLIKQAVAAGIPVVVVNTGIDTYVSDGAVGFVGEVPPDTGHTAGEAMLAGGVKNVVCVNQSPGNPAITQRCAGIAAVMAANGGTSAVENIPLTDSSNPSASTADIQGYLSSHKNVDGVFTNAAEIAVDALAAVKNLGKTATIKVATADLSSSVLGDIQSGTLLFTVDQQPYLQGFLPIEILDFYVKYGIRPTAPIDTGGLLIDKANVAGLLAVQKANPDVLGS